MPALLFTDQIVPTTATATTAQAGYAATNILRRSISQPWWSTSTSANDVVIDCGADTAKKVLHVHDCNFASAPISTAASAAPGSFTARGTLTTYENDAGRRRGWIELSDSDRYVKIGIASGTPADNLAYWRIGSAYLMATKNIMPSDLQFGFDIAPTEPVIATDLTNGRRAQAIVGNDFDVLELKWRRKYSEVMKPMVKKTREGLCIFVAIDVNTYYPEQSWPVMRYEAKRETFDRWQHSMLTTKLREEV